MYKFFQKHFFLVFIRKMCNEIKSDGYSYIYYVCMYTKRSAFNLENTVIDNQNQNKVFINEKALHIKIKKFRLSR